MEGKNMWRATPENLLRLVSHTKWPNLTHHHPASQTARPTDVTSGIRTCSKCQWGRTSRRRAWRPETDSWHLRCFVLFCVSPRVKSKANSLTWCVCSVKILSTANGCLVKPGNLLLKRPIQWDHGKNSTATTTLLDIPISHSKNGGPEGIWTEEPGWSRVSFSLLQTYQWLWRSSLS